MHDSSIRLVIFLILSFCAPTVDTFGTSITVPYPYTMFKQCDRDGLWKNEIIDTKTLCAAGSFVTSLAMALSGAGLRIPIAPNSFTVTPNVNSSSSPPPPLKMEPVTPKSLITWLRDNVATGGLDNVIESLIPRIDPRITWPEDGMHRANDLPFETLVSYLQKGRVIIGNVNSVMSKGIRGGEHFVLIVGYSSDSDTLAVNDPTYEVDTYSYQFDLMGYRIFDIEFVRD
jgi:hypothetical protein